MTPVDTIVAPASPNGESAIAILRLSGPDVPRIANAACGITSVACRKAVLCRYTNRKGEHLDTLVGVLYAEGNSFTGEWLLELFPHGNPYLIRKLLDDMVARGCRLAEPGEFSKRAFLNGKLDLSQAEAIQQFIQARSDRALKAAKRQLEGSVGETVNRLVERLLGITAAIEAYIDFPEEDLPDENQAGPARDLQHLCSELAELIATRDYAVLLHDGAKCVLLGEPNSGKSSLLNALTGEARVIVSDQPGTTRDYVEERIKIGPYLLRVVDTAGLHDAVSTLEQEGIRRSLSQADTADIVLLVLDSTRPSPTLPQRISDKINPQNCLVLHNKSDLPGAGKSAGEFGGVAQIATSALTGSGLDQLRRQIIILLESGKIIPDEEAVIVSSRHAHALERARNALATALDKIRCGESGEWIAADLREAIDALGEITGKIDNESMLDQLFANFCIGK